MKERENNHLKQELRHEKSMWSTYMVLGGMIGFVLGICFFSYLINQVNKS
jgi:hypothetical protein